MSDVEIPKSVPCKFDEKGWTPCRKPSNNGLCSKHENEKCVSCGGQALRSCDAGMGGLACGSSLCATCQHSMEGGCSHVTQEVFETQMKEEIELRETGKESKRMLELRGVRTDVELSSNVGDIIDQSPSGFVAKACYVILVDSGHVFPAILKNTRIPVITVDKNAAIRVLQSLRPRKFKLQCGIWMVNEELGVCYRYDNDKFERTQSRPCKLFSAAEIEDHFTKTDAPFEWAPGLIGGNSISKTDFEMLIKQEV